MDDPFEIDRKHPSFQAQLAAEKQVNVYFVPGTDTSGNPRYVYAVTSAMLHEQFITALDDGEIPDYAVIVATGTGEPDNDVKEKIKHYYGFDHEAANSN